MININPQDHNDNTPLHFAAEKGYLNICKLIMQNVYVYDKNPENNFGVTPLHLAAKVRSDS